MSIFYNYLYRKHESDYIRYYEYEYDGASEKIVDNYVILLKKALEVKNATIAEYENQFTNVCLKLRQAYEEIGKLDEEVNRLSKAQVSDLREASSDYEDKLG